MSVIDEYLNGVAEPHKAVLERVRSIVKQAAPDAEEAISYGMPAFKYKGKYLVGFFAFKDHLSLFPTSGPVAALKDELEGFTTFKGTIRFTAEAPLPEATIKAIVLARLADISKK